MADYNKTRDIRIGLEIFERHGGVFCQAEHDEFFAGQKDGEALTQEEVDTLLAARWRISSEFCRGCGDEGDGDAPGPRAPQLVLIHKEAGNDGEDVRHLATCNQWAIFT